MTTWVSKDKTKSYYGQEVTKDASGKIAPISSESATKKSQTSASGGSPSASNKPKEYEVSVGGKKAIISEGVKNLLEKNNEQIYETPSGIATTQPEVAEPARFNTDFAMHATREPANRQTTDQKPRSNLGYVASVIKTDVKESAKYAGGIIETGASESNQFIQNTFLDPNYKQRIDYTAARLGAGSGDKIGDFVGQTYRGAALQVTEKPTGVAATYAAGFVLGSAVSSANVGLQMVGESSPWVLKAAPKIKMAADIGFAGLATASAYSEYKRTGGIGETAVTLAVMGAGAESGAKNNFILTQSSPEVYKLKSTGDIATIRSGDRFAVTQVESGKYATKRTYDLFGMPVRESKYSTLYDVYYRGSGTGRTGTQTRTERIGEFKVKSQETFSGKPIGEPVFTQGNIAASDVKLPKSDITYTSYESRVSGSSDINYGIQKSRTRNIGKIDGFALKGTDTLTYDLGKKPISPGYELEPTPNTADNIIRKIARSGFDNNAVVGSRTFTGSSTSREYNLKYPTASTEVVNVGGKEYKVEVGSSAKPKDYTRSFTRTSSESFMGAKGNINKVASEFEGIYPKRTQPKIAQPRATRSRGSSGGATSSGPSKLKFQTETITIPESQSVILTNVRTTPKIQARTSIFPYTVVQKPLVTDRAMTTPVSVTVPKFKETTSSITEQKPATYPQIITPRQKDTQIITKVPKITTKTSTGLVSITDETTLKKTNIVTEPWLNYSKTIPRIVERKDTPLERGFNFDKFLGYGTSRAAERRKKESRKYTPSLTSLAVGLKAATGPTKGLTGLEVRPLITGARKRRKAPKINVNINIKR